MDLHGTLLREDLADALPQQADVAHGPPVFPLVQDLRQRAECNIHVKGNDMFAESSHQDLYAAVDELVDKLDRQVVRYKDKLQDHHHATAKRLM